jgi:hypothetical protein
MRKAIVSTVVGMLGITAWPALSSAQAWSSPPQAAPPSMPDWSLHSVPPPPSPPTKVWVHLNGVADLERLRATNFNHYLRAQKILAAANEICRPGAAHTIPTRFIADYPNCESSMWLTSNPPKKLLTFHLDDVGYIARVSVTVSGARFQELAARAAPAR